MEVRGATDRRWPVIVAAFGVLALATPAQALAKPHKTSPVQIEVPTPTEGNVSIEGVTLTVRAHGAGAVPTSLLAPNEAALPESVLALTATREVHGRRTDTFHTVLLALNVRAGATAARARAASPENALQPYTPNSLIEGGHAEQVPADERGLVFLFTGILPPLDDFWTANTLGHASTVLTVGAQPNANAGATDPRVCAALAAAVPLEPAGKMPTGVTFGINDAGHAAGHWGLHPNPSQKAQIAQALEDASRNCKAGAGGLDVATTDLVSDLALAAGTLGPTPGGPTPIGKEQYEQIVFDAELNEESDVIEEATEDYVMWLEEESFGGASPWLESLGASLRAHAASGSTSGAVPANGKVTQVKVRGYYVGGCPAAESVCQENVHFQDLRPLSGGELEVHSTTQAFKLPSTPGTYTFEPSEFYVQKGDYIGMATVGGKFEVLVSHGGATTEVFVGHNKDMNGSHVRATKTQSGTELNMQVTLKPSG